ncbi:hypothetical protein V1514DRAFT_331651 [Lipomyces japonicus]|uniref:uncharacterized protein n=1 Tax=Lipomyces japonicus TaxID=56871 RepID=UPI0034CF5F8C
MIPCRLVFCKTFLGDAWEVRSFSTSRSINQIKSPKLPTYFSEGSIPPKEFKPQNTTIATGGTVSSNFNDEYASKKERKFKLDWLVLPLFASLCYSTYSFYVEHEKDVAKLRAMEQNLKSMKEMHVKKLSDAERSLNETYIFASSLPLLHVGMLTKQLIDHGIEPVRSDEVWPQFQKDVSRRVNSTTKLPEYYVVPRSGYKPYTPLLNEYLKTVQGKIILVPEKDWNRLNKSALPDSGQSKLD